MVHYGFPEHLHSDQGRDFESHTIKELCALAGIRKVRTSPYNPRGNPVERYNRTLLSMLGTLREKEKTQWRDHVNCTRNDVTGFSPYELMFGRQPRLPLDLAFGLPVKEKEPSSHSQYVKNLRSHLEESYQIAIENSQKVTEKNKKRFDRVVRECTLAAGDRVLVRNIRLRGKHKLADRWESTVYVVTKQMGDLPVYSVKPEKEEGPSRTLHRDLLLPCGFLPETEREVQSTNRPKRPRTRQQSAIQQDEEPFDIDDESQESWYTTLPNVQDRRFIKVYDMPRHNFAPPQHNYGPEVAKPHPFHASVTEEEEREIEYSETLRPEKETVNLPGEETGNFSGAETQDPPEMEIQNSPGDLLDTSEAVDESPMEPKANDNTKEEIPTAEKTDGRTETGTTVRRSLRQREPARRFHYPELGNPLVSVVTSLFQGLSTALTNSLNDSASRDWFTSIPFEMAETVVTQQPFNNAPGRALGKEGRV